MLRFKFLFELSKTQTEQLKNIVADKEVMKWIGKGKTWTSKYVDDLIKFSKDDYGNNFKTGDYCYIGVLNKNTIIGLGGIHPMTDKRNIQLLVLLNPKYHGLGFSKQIISKLIDIKKEYFKNKKFYSVVAINNTNSNNMMNKYKKVNFIKLGDKYYNVYEIS